MDFIVNFAEVNCIILPGHAPGHWKTDVKLLPSNYNKRKVYESCCAVAELSGVHKVALHIFSLLWQQLMPYVTTMLPAIDLCWYCQKNSVKVMRSANLPDEEKSEIIKQAERHLQ